MQTPNPNWRLPHDNESEIIYQIRDRRSRLGLGLMGGALLMFFGYWVIACLQSWFVGGEEVLVGGVVIFGVMLAGAAFGVYVLGRLGASTRYLFEPERLRAEHSFLGKEKVQEVERARVKEVIKAYTPPKQAGLDGVYATLLLYEGRFGKTQTLAFEGSSQAEQEWLSGLVSAWAKVSCHNENTTD